MATGTVRWFAQETGHGVITRDRDGDVFVHHTALQALGQPTLHEGMRVEFEVVAGTHGDEAINVTVLA